MADRKTNMPYVSLGRSGLKVSKIILGTMQYGNPEWDKWVLGEKEGIQHIKAAYDAGINTFDTADSYSNGESEIILGKAIKQHNLPRDEIVVMTKLGFAVGRTPDAIFYLPTVDPEGLGYVNQKGSSRKHIISSVKKSLERLQLDYVDVLLCHRFDYDTPIEETMKALDDVVKAGYVRYIGMSSCHAWQFHAMQNYAVANKLTPFIVMQNHYSLLNREEEREMLPTLKLFGVGCTPWSPLARGVLTRPFTERTKRTETDVFIVAYGQTSTGEIVNRVEKISKKMGISMAQVAVAWLLSKEGVTAPIVGTTSMQNLEDIIAGVHVKLTEEDIKYLEEPYQPQGIYGYF